MSKAGAKGKKVLVVDDACLVQAAVQAMLEDIGCMVVTANNGQEAVDAFDSSFQLILMDYNMPEMNGDEATRIIRQKEALFKVKRPVYVVGLTANNSEKINEACIKAGMNKVAEKPISPEALQKLLYVLDD